MATPFISVIIPTVDEAEHLPALLADLTLQSGIRLEVIVGDGGSSDATEAVATGSGARFVVAGRGRGAQMNVAAGSATGYFLLFLHADSRLDDPKLLCAAVQALRERIDTVGDDAVAGHFRLRFIRSSSRHAGVYRHMEEKTALNRPGTTNGDQGFLMTRAFFARLGGFDERLPFLEDQRLAAAIRGQGRWITLPGSIATSARRFESEGVYRRYIFMSMMMGLHSIGMDDFFVRAPGVYRTQQDTGTLFLTPFFRIIRQMMRHEWGVRGTVRTFFHLGRYIRENSWQPFFAMDVRTRPPSGSSSNRFLAFHDRIVAPLIDFRVVDALAGLLCCIWFMGVLAPWFWLCDSSEPKSVVSCDRSAGGIG